MLTITKIDKSTESITFSFVNSLEGRELMEIVIDSIVSSHFGLESKQVKDWVRLNIPQPDNSKIDKTFSTKKI